MIHPALKRLCQFLAAAIGVLAMITAFGLWRLSSGPISLAILTPYMEDALSDNDAPFRLFFDDLILTWAGWERTLDIRAIDVRAFSVDGQTLAAIPEMAVGLSLPAMAHGLVAPTRIEIYGPNIQVTRHPDGSIEFGGGTSDTAGGAIGEILIDNLLAPPAKDRPSGYLRELKVVGAHLVIEDEALAATWRAPHTDIVIARQAGGIRVDLSGVFDLGEVGVEVASTATLNRKGRLGDLTVDFTEFVPADLAALTPGLAPLSGVRLPLGGRIRLTGADPGDPKGVVFDLYGGPGVVDLPDIDAQLSDRKIAFMQARGEIEPGLRGLRVDELFVDFDGPRLELAGRFTGAITAPDTIAELTLSDLPVAQIEQFWPPNVAAGGRSWILGHARGGQIDRLNMRLNLRAEDWPKALLDRQAVVGVISFSEATIDYLDGMQPATDVWASGRFDAVDVDVQIERGRLGAVRIDGASIQLRDLDREGEGGVFEGQLIGPLRDTLAMLSVPRFQFPQAVGLDPADVESGEMRTDLRLALPLRGDVSLDDIQLNVSADLTGVAVGGASVPAYFRMFGGVRGEARLRASEKDLQLSGYVDLGGIPSRVMWKEVFAPGPEVIRRQLDIDGQADEMVRARLGLFTDRVTGPLDVSVQLRNQDGMAPTRVVTIDAVGAAISLPELDWVKPAGVPAVATFGLKFDAGAVVGAENIEVRAEGLSGRGGVALATAENEAATIRVDQLKFGDSEIAGLVRVRRDGPHEVVLRGGRADLRPFLVDTGAGGGDPPALVVSGALAAARVGENIMLYDVTGGLTYDGQRVTDARLTADFGDQEPIAMEIATEGSQRVIRVASDSGGSVARAMGIFDKMNGGALRIVAVIDDSHPSHPMRGRVLISDFRVVDAPLLTKMLTIGSLTGALELLDGEGMPFDRLRAEFQLIDDQLTISRSSATGLSLGITMEGTIDLETDNADLKGTIVPAYAINSALGEIPMIGEFLVGGQDEGVFAMTYVMNGQIDDPSIVVNPLAALTPGFLRDFFDSFNEDATNQANDIPFEDRARTR